MENFTPVTSIIGGLLIGLAASVLLWTNGKISGISGILAGSLFTFSQDGFWRLALGVYGGFVRRWNHLSANDW
jgi:uncharacterized protein